MFNKAVLDTMDFPFPMFLTSWHMFVSTFMTQIMSSTTSMLPGVAEVLRQNAILIFVANFIFLSIEKSYPVRCEEQNSACRPLLFFQLGVVKQSIHLPICFVPTGTFIFLLK
jgi:hypothetical protein